MRDLEARGPPEGTVRGDCLACHRWRGGRQVRFGGAPCPKSAATRLVFPFAACCGVKFQVVKASIASVVQSDGPSGHCRIRMFPWKALPAFSEHNSNAGGEDLGYFAPRTSPFACRGARPARRA